MPFTIRPFLRFLVNRFLAMPLAYGLGFETLIALQVLSSIPAYAEWVKIYEDLPECPAQKGGDEWQPVAKRR